MLLKVGDKLGHYEVISLLGKGGNGGRVEDAGYDEIERCPVVTPQLSKV